MAFMASPEEYPGAGLMLQVMASNKLKRFVISGPIIFLTLRNWLMGAISPLIRTKMLFSDCSSKRYLGSAWIMIRYTLENKLKLDA